MKLDYKIKDVEGRLAYVDKVIKATPSERLNSQYLSYMSDYILFVADRDQTKKEQKEEAPIVTKNREVTVSKRQTSLETLTSNLENGEDGLYALIANDKNQIMDCKEKISDKDIAEVPGLKDCLDTIEKLKRQFDSAQGQEKYYVKRQIIETWQQIYILKSSFRSAPAKGRTSNQIKTMARMVLDEAITLDEDGFPRSSGLVSLFNPAHISFLLCYYSQLKQETKEEFGSDMHYLLMDLEELVDQTLLEDYPILYDLLVWKIDGLSNKEIQSLMESHHGVKHNEQYWSTLWRKRIPNMLCRQAQENWLIWHFTNEAYGNWKTCGRCGETKLAHPMFFSKNKSLDGYYSICKACRSQNGKVTKRKEEKKDANNKE